MSDQTTNLSTKRLNLTFRNIDNRLLSQQLTVNGLDWLHPTKPSSWFSFTIDGDRIDATNLPFDHVEEAAAGEGVQHLLLVFQGSSIRVEQHILLYENYALIECWPVIFNTGPDSFTIQRVDSISINLPELAGELLAYTGNWGSEFEPHTHALENQIILESRSGRSSKGNHPWFALTRASGEVLSGAVAWSGNWVFRFEPLPDGGGCLSGGLHDWEFAKTLQPGESMEGAPVILALGINLDDVAQQYARVGQKHWYPRSELAGRLPVEWNHWWPYEDVEINETVFACNVERAAQMGFEVCTLDAGWFGPSDPDTFWYDYRGDWHLVNQRRFPNSIRPVADQVHAHGMKFGIWCEIESLGVKAQLALDHPEYVATRAGERLGYVCFGNPQVQEWAYATLARLITEYQCDWIKVDFNLDPGAGCDRSDHGHQTGDGLYEHIRGYYRTLERIRRDYPQVVLENCSSGGLRIDLGMLRRTDMTYLSDPDYPVHDLQIFWGASTMLSADRLLHWTYSHWRNIDPPPQQTFNPRDPALTKKKWDYYSRISMLGFYGISQKLPDLPEWLAQRIIEHNAIYQKVVRRFVKEANLYRLTAQPRRSGEGERWSAFQYALPDEKEHLLFVFRLPGAEAQRTICLKALQPERIYTVQGLEGEFTLTCSGASLMQEGLHFSDLEEEDSALLLIC